MSVLQALLDAAAPGTAGPALLALAAALRASPGLVVAGLDLEACVAPGGGDARDPEQARIVQIALIEVSAWPLPGQVDATDASHAEASGEQVPEGLERVHPGPGGLYWREDATLVDPLCDVDAASARVHGITRDRLDEAEAPRIDDLVMLLDSALRPQEGGSLVLVGYNARGYDAPLLAAELRRAAKRLRREDPERADVAERLAEHLLAAEWADPLAVRRRAEPMDLGGSVRRYLGADLQGAHDARADIAGTVLCLAAQLTAGHATGLADALVASAPPPGAYDRAGKLVCDEGVDPAAATAAQVRYAFGNKARGKSIAEDPGFGRWMLGQDFPEETKARVRALLATLPADAGARSAHARRR